MRTSRGGNEGFTLVEVLVVMVVLSVLAGIVLMAVGTFRDDAEQGRDEANGKQCATILAAYRVQHSGSDPTSWDQIADRFMTPPPDRCGLAEASTFSAR